MYEYVKSVFTQFRILNSETELVNYILVRISFCATAWLLLNANVFPFFFFVFGYHLVPANRH